MSRSAALAAGTTAGSSAGTTAGTTAGTATRSAGPSAGTAAGPSAGPSRRRAAGSFVLLAAALGGAGCTSSALLAPGQRPPESLSAVDQHGKTQSIGAQKGRPLVVYFYPADGTPGCTTEACAFRDAWDGYSQAGVMVFGVSGDDQASKEQFAKEEKLPFPILADPEHRWAEAFGVGTTLGMMDRVTFLLGPDGAVSKVYPDVDPGVHAKEVLADAKALVTGSKALTGGEPK